MYVQPSSYNLPPKYTTASYASLRYKLFQALSGSLILLTNPCLARRVATALQHFNQPHYNVQYTILD